MSGETSLTIIGNLTADPVIRYLNNDGDAVVNFTVASTPRVFDSKTKQWKDGPALFMRCTQWREAGEHVANSLSKGDRVIVVGKLQQRDYQDREGVKRTVVELVADEVGTSLKYAVAKPVRSKARGSGRPTPKAGGGAGANDDPYAGFQPSEDEVA
ncbi:single-stranded DNA-binding protein [Nocardia yamanashiensis]|uniref:single-stranded DNA-binding protein n=1 Tax=Nocardia yamanashiensis TaxID=209247 RepID=UPI001E284F55|nr:single-stranded DNA-binding protein [Nocardia yamanashiensis]UGT45156.1 single-stranded DNA-binding protein [Nocardia yamanashiensis]